METLASGSDFAPFIAMAGIPSADIWFKRDAVRNSSFLIYAIQMVKLKYLNL